MSDSNTCCSKCSSYDSSHWEKDENGYILCENCNENLIARNLVNELMQHEVKINGSDEEDDNEDARSEPKDNDLNREDEEETKQSGSESEEDEDSGQEEDEEIGKPDKNRKRKREEDSEEEDGDGPVVRRSIRKTLNKYKYPDYEPQEPPAAISRRKKAFSKENVYKAPTATATCVTSQYVFHKGVYYQLGDIVALVDSEGHGVFYAQITGFMRDTYCNKSATIQWLLPTKESPPHNVAFDPRTYYLGFIEETPRPLDCMIPVMHAPCDYYRFNDSPYPPIFPPPHITNLVWKNLDRIYINVRR